MILNETFTLSNGVKIPKIGLGTWQIPDGEEAYNSVMFALKNGYRHIDTAKASMDRPMARMSISNTLISFCTPLSVKTANGL